MLAGTPRWPDVRGDLAQQGDEVPKATCHTQTLHVWYIYLHWGGFGGQCRHIWHTWSVWDMMSYVNP